MMYQKHIISTYKRLNYKMNGRLLKLKQRSCNMS